MAVHKRTKIKSYLLYADTIFYKLCKYNILTLYYGSAYGNSLNL